MLFSDTVPIRAHHDTARPTDRFFLYRGRRIAVKK